MNRIIAILFVLCLPSIALAEEETYAERAEAEQRIVDTLNGKYSRVPAPFPRSLNWFPDGTPTYFNHDVKWYRQAKRLKRKAK